MRCSTPSPRSRLLTVESLGHSLKDVHEILQKHYLDPDLRLGVNAIRKLEKHSNHPQTPNWLGPLCQLWVKNYIGAP